MPNIPNRATRPQPELQQLAALGIVVLDHRLSLLHMSARARRLLPTGATAGELFANIHAADPDFNLADEIQSVVTSGQSKSFERLSFRLNGRLTQLTADCEPLHQTPDHPRAGCIVLLREPDRTQRNGFAAERLASVGAMTARVAHELNNLLDGILRYTNLAINAPDDAGSQKVARYLEESKTGLLRMIRITRELLEFSRTKPATGKYTSIAEILGDAVNLMQSAAQERGVEILLEAVDSPVTGPVSAHLFQVSCNLIKNAIEAMPDGGTLNIQAVGNEHELTITFQDTGAGLPQEAERVFEAFFTTRDPGQGTGLGLAICRDLVEKCCDGTITAENRPRGGACFTIRMPLDSNRLPGEHLGQS